MTLRVFAKVQSLDEGHQKLGQQFSSADCDTLIVYSY